MSIYRCTAFLRDDDGHGWTESHDYSTPSPGDTDLAARAEIFNQLMMTKRVPLLAGDGFYLGCRIAKFQPGSNAKVQSFPLFLDTPAQGTIAYSSKAVQMDASLLAVKVTFASINGTSRADVYLRGVWEQVITAGQLDFNGQVGGKFAQLLKDYQDALIAGEYGWVGKADDSTKGNCVGYVQNPTGTITFSLANLTGVALPAAGTKVQAFFARLNNSNSVLNRSILCRVVDATTLESVQQIAAGPYLSQGTFYVNSPLFFRYALVAYRKLAARKTGRPTGVGRGRLSARRAY